MIILWLLVQVVQACRPSPYPDWIKVSPRIEPLLTLRFPHQYEGDFHLKGDKLLWRDKDREVWTYSDRATVSRWQYEHQKRYPIALSLDPGSILLQELQDHPGLDIYIPSRNGQDAFLLVVPESDEDQVLISAMAHSGGGLPCGRVSAVSGFALQASSDHHPYPPIYEESIFLDKVDELIKSIDMDLFKENLKELVDLNGRGHNTENGRVVPSLLKNKIERQTKTSLEIEFEEQSVPNSLQSNLIVRIPSNTSDEVVIFGAHMDTIGGRNQGASLGGADDDASGMAVLVEIIRIISDLNLKFERTLEFHFYAAEEVGRLGSIDLAQRYREDGIKIAAMMQFDMVLYGKNLDPTIYLVTNDTSQVLRRRVMDLAHTYLDKGIKEMSLERGTSDHKSWSDVGYSAVFPFENPSDFNPNIHTVEDVIPSTMNWALPQKFIGLAVAFSGHYGGLIDSKDDYLEKQSKRIDFDNLKIQLKAEGKSYGIIVSSDTDSAEVRYCLGMVNPFNQCQSNLRVLKQKGSKKGRYFFYDEKLTESLQNEDSLILFAYDKDQVLQRKRVVSLKKR